MTKQEIIELIQRRLFACELALHDLYTLPIPNDDKSIDIIRLEEQIAVLKSLLNDIF